MSDRATRLATFGTPPPAPKDPLQAMMFHRTATPTLSLVAPFLKGQSRLATPEERQQAERENLLQIDRNASPAGTGKFLGGDEIRSGTPRFKLPPIIQERVVNPIREGLRGLEGQGVSREIDNPISTRGLGGFLEWRNRQDKIEYLQRDLVEKAGTDPDRAWQIAAEAVSERNMMTRGGGKNMEGITEDEKKIINRREWYDRGWDALAMLDVFTAGTASALPKVTIKTAQRIAKMDNVSDIRSFLVREAGFTPEGARLAAPKLVPLNDASMIVRALEMSGNTAFAGRAKDAFKAIAKTDSEVAIASILRRELGIVDQTTVPMAKVLTNVDDPKIVGQFLKERAREMAKIPEFKQVAPPKPKAISPEDIAEAVRLAQEQRATRRSPLPPKAAQTEPSSIPKQAAKIKATEPAIFPQKTARPAVVEGKITKEKIVGRTPEEPVTIRKTPTVLLREKLRGAQVIARRASVATRRDAKTIQGEIIKLLEDLPLKERGRFLSTVKNTQNMRDVQRALPEIIARIERALRKAQNLKTGDKIHKAIKRVKPRAGPDKLMKGKLTAQHQKRIDDMKEVLYEKPTVVDGVETFPKADKRMEQLMDAQKTNVLDGKPADPLQIADEMELLQMSGILSSKRRLAEVDPELLKRIEKNINDIIETGMTENMRVRENMRSEWGGRIADSLSDKVTAQWKDTSVETPNRKGLKRLWDGFGEFTNLERNLDSFVSKAQSYAVITSNKFGFGPVYDTSLKLKESNRNYVKGVLQTEDHMATALHKIYSGGKTSYVSRLKTLGELNKSTDLGTFVKRPGVEGPSKIQLKLTKSQIIAKWMQMQQEHTLARLKHGNGFTDEMFNAIEGAMTDKDKRFARFLLDEYYPSIHKQARETYELQTGLYLPDIFNYSPSPTKQGQSVPVHVREAMQRAKGTTKPSAIRTREDLSNLADDAVVSPLEFDSAIDTAMGHGIEMMSFIHKTEAVNQWRLLMGPNSSFRQSLDKMFEKNFTKTMDGILDRFANGGVRDVERVNQINGLTNAFATSVLSMNVTQTPKQMVSTTMWFIEDAGMIVANLPKSAAKHRATIKEMTENSTFLQSRYRKHTYNVHANEHFERGKTLENLMQKEGVTTAGMRFVQAGDRFGIMGLGVPYYLGKKAQYIRKGLPEKEAIQKAIRDFEYQAERIQQSSDLLNTSVIQKGGAGFGVLGRAASLFLGTPKQFLRYEEHLIRSIMMGHGNTLESAMKIALIHGNFMMFQYVADGFRFDEERQARAGLLGPLGSVFILGSAIDTGVRAATGDDVFNRGVALTGFQKLGDFGYSVGSQISKSLKEPSIEEVIESLALVIQTAMELRGVPASNIRKLFENTYEYATGASTDPREIIYSDYALDKKKESSSSSGAALPSLPSLPKLPSLPSL